MLTLTILAAAVLGAMGDPSNPDTNATPSAATAPTITSTNVPATNAPTTNPDTAPPMLRKVSPGVFEYHGVKLDKKNHRVSFPGTVNQKGGLIEYLLVNEKGKVHESLLATKVPPHDIHIALLLIGLKDPGTNANAPLPPSAIDSAYLQAAPKLKGPPVRITVAWTPPGGQRKEIPAENWIQNLDSNKTMTPGAWTYNGSQIENGVFIADEELSIISVITDPTALVNNPRKGYDNDQIWQIKDEVPPIDTPVEIGITLGNELKP
jgi:hypothetical protein